MIINGKTVQYLFGPSQDLNIGFCVQYDLEGISYESLPISLQLTLQIVCHAIHQINVGPLDDYEGKYRWRITRKDMITDIEYHVNSNRIEAERVTRPLTYERYNLYIENRLVLSLEESSIYDFAIAYCDLYGNNWIEELCDYAIEHCRRFGRR